MFMITQVRETDHLFLNRFAFTWKVWRFQIPIFSKEYRLIVALQETDLEFFGKDELII
jgi:hypothetical protein